MKRQIGRSILSLLLVLAMLSSLALPAFAEGSEALIPPPATAESMPEESAPSDESAPPEEGAPPEESPVPEESPAPEESPVPGESPVPEESPAPEESPVPEESPIPEEMDPVFAEAAVPQNDFRSQINIALGEKTYASSSWNGAWCGAESERIADGQTNDQHWCPAEGGDQWVVVDFGTLRQFTRVEVVFNYAERVHGFQLEAYDWDKESWVPFHTYEGDLSAGNGITVTVTLGEPVQSSRVRLHFGAETELPCVSELRLFNDSPLIPGARIQITTTAGVPPTLPQQFNISQENGGRVLVPIQWEEVDPHQWETPGEYTVTGTYAPEDITVTAQITVTQDRGIAEAPTPYMGWNHWYADYMDVTQDKVNVQIDKLQELGLDKAGYNMIWIDDGGWGRPSNEYPEEEFRYRDEEGNILFNDRFNRDMGAFVQSVHDRGLKFGIYTDTGPSGCGSIFGSGGPNWFENYRKDVALYESWGVDAIKLDHCGGHNGLLTNYEVYAGFYQAMRAEDPDANMLLNVCEWGQEDPASWAYKIAATWRTGGDLGRPATLEPVYRQFDINISPNANRTGAYNDPDYLMIGDYGLNDDQERTYFTLWAISAGPLILSCDLNMLTEDNIATLTNPDMIAINQDPLVRQPILLREDVEGLQVYAKELQATQEGKARYAVMLLNRTGEEATIGFNWSDIGLSGVRSVRNVWESADERVGGPEYSAVVSSDEAVVLIAEGDPMDRTGTRPLNNLAWGAVAQANSSWSSSNRAEMVMDEDAGSYWSGGSFTDADGAYWIQLDFGRARTFDEIILTQGEYFERPRASRLQYQDEQGNWQTITEIGALAKGENQFTFEPVTARVVRWYVEQSGTVDEQGQLTTVPPTLQEFQVFLRSEKTNDAYENMTDACLSENLALKAAASASSIYSDGYNAARINDGDTGSRWNSAVGAPEDECYVQLDFEQPVQANHLKILFGEWYQRVGKATLLVDAGDGTGWQEIAVLALNPEEGQTAATPTVSIRSEESRAVKSLRLRFDEKLDWYDGVDPSLYEIQLFQYPYIKTEPVRCAVRVGEAPALPQTVMAVRGDRLNKTVKVTWEDVDPSLYAKPGSFTVKGALEGIPELAAEAQVDVYQEGDEIPIHSIEFVKDTVQVEEGKTVQLEVRVGPDNHTEPVFFETCCPKLATVDENGLVTGKCPGTVATITARNRDGTVLDTCNVEILKAQGPAPTQKPDGGGSQEPSATATPAPAVTPAPTAKPGKGGAVKPTATPEVTESPVPEETAAPTAKPTPEPEQPDEGETVEPEETPAAAPENGSPWLLWAAIGVAVCAALVLIVVLWKRRRNRED